MQAAPPPEIAGSVDRFIRERRGHLDRWFFAIRTTLGLGAAGYLSVDALQDLEGVSEIMLVLATYVALNTVTWAYSGKSGTHARWIYMAIDLAFVLVLRHAFVFEVLVDANATMVAFFTLILLTYTVYGDPALNRVLAGLTISAAALTLCLDLVGRHMLESGVLTYRRYPLRVLLILSYLSAFCLLTYALASRLREHVLDYAVELHKRLEAVMTTAAERTRREKLEQLNRLKRDFIEVLSHELRTPLTPLRSSLEMMRSTRFREKDDTELLGIALASTAKLHRLVQDYTQLAELLTDERDSVLRWNIRLLTLLDALQTEADLKRVVVEDVDDLVVSADPRLLAAAILSLIRRAQLVSSPSSLVTLRGFAEGSGVVLAIHDPESQIECDIGDMLDDPFMISSERTFGSRNTGLELILARHSLQRIGGSLRIVSGDGRGTTVLCSLPGRRHGSQWLNESQIRFEIEPLRAFSLS
ncbi:MAG: HAMP domain-containing sensor histidine kinase [Rhodothermales bacterium]